MKSKFLISIATVFLVLTSCISNKELLSIDHSTSKKVPSQNVSLTYANQNLGGEHYSNLAQLLSGFNKIRFNEEVNHSLDSLNTNIEYDGYKKPKVKILSLKKNTESIELPD
jgi:hypothetical protein